MSKLDSLQEGKKALQHIMEIEESAKKLKESRTFKKLLDHLFVSLVSELQRDLVREVPKQTDMSKEHKQLLLTSLTVVNNLLDDYIQNIPEVASGIQEIQKEIDMHMTGEDDDRY